MTKDTACSHFFLYSLEKSQVYFKIPCFFCFSGSSPQIYSPFSSDRACWNHVFQGTGNINISSFALVVVAAVKIIIANSYMKLTMSRGQLPTYFPHINWISSHNNLVRKMWHKRVSDLHKACMCVWYACVCKCLCIYVHVCVYIWMNTCTCVCKYRSIYINYVYLRMYIHGYICLYSYVNFFYKIGDRDGICSQSPPQIYPHNYRVILIEYSTVEH